MLADKLLNEIADFIRENKEREKYIKHETALDRHIKQDAENKDFKIIYCLPSIDHDKRVLIKLANNQTFAITIKEIQ